MTPSSSRLRLAPDAENDLSAILQYSLDTWGTVQRDAYAAALTEAFATLSEFPEIGRERNDLFPALRSCRVQRHMIYYQTDDQELRIFRILHVRMDRKGELARFMPDPGGS